MTTPTNADLLEALVAVLEARREADPERSYVASLYAKGVEGIGKKVGEEAAEFVMAAKDGDPDAMIYEAADLWFHTLVMLTYHGIEGQNVLTELARRLGVSGHEAKAARGSS